MVWVAVRIQLPLLPRCSDQPHAQGHHVGYAGCALCLSGECHSQDRSVNSNPARILWFQGRVGVDPGTQTQRDTYTYAHVMSRKDTGIPS